MVLSALSCRWWGSWCMLFPVAHDDFGSPRVGSCLDLGLPLSRLIVLCWSSCPYGIFLMHDMCRFMVVFLVDAWCVLSRDEILLYTICVAH